LINAPDGAAGVTLRATIEAAIDVVGTRPDGSTDSRSVSHKVALYGPGDIIGIDRRAIVRTEPHDWITNFEPNFLAHIEFYDEDFPWRYTPAAPDGAGRLRPWLTLAVLAEGEFKDGLNTRDRPLPYVEIADLGSLPKASELWAWAHVHVNRGLQANAAEFLSK